MGKDFTVTVYGERGEEFDKVFGTRTVNVLLPFPHMAKLKDQPEAQAVYMLDVALLTDEQRANLVQHIATKFNAAADDVSDFLASEGLPILATDTVAMVDHPQKWLMDDTLDDDHVLMSDLDDCEFDEFDGYDEDYA